MDPSQDAYHIGDKLDTIGEYLAELEELENIGTYLAKLNDNLRKLTDALYHVGKQP